MSDISGICLAMQTPFDASGKVDYKQFEALIEQYLEAGMHGFLLSSGTGQHAYLTEAECNKLFEIGVKRIDGRAYVMGQSSALNMDEVIRRTKSAQDLGVGSVLVLPPFFEGPTHDDGIFNFYEKVNAAVSIDIVGYNIPEASGIELSPELFMRLNELENFNYIKDSTGDIAKQQALLATGGKVINGADPTAVFSFMSGCVGSIWGCANIFPKQSVDLYELVKAGQLAAALELWQTMFPIIDACWQGDYIPYVKAAAKLAGYDGGPVRAPVCPPSAEVVAELSKRLESLK